MKTGDIIIVTNIKRFKQVRLIEIGSEARIISICQQGDYKGNLKAYCVELLNTGKIDFVFSDEIRLKEN